MLCCRFAKNFELSIYELSYYAYFLRVPEMSGIYYLWVIERGRVFISS